LTNLSDVLTQRAAQDPERIGLAFDGGGEWSYGAIATASDVMAARFAHSFASHDDPNDRKAVVYLQNSPIMVFVILGLWRARVTAVPVNVMYKTEEIQNALAKTAPAVVVTTAERAATVRDAGFTGEIIEVDTMPAAELDQPVAFEPPLGLDEVDAIVLFTGGSTGQPKAVTVTHEGFGASLDGLVTASKGGRPGPYPLASTDVPPNLLYFPLFHAGGINALLFAWAVGRSVVLMERFRAQRVVELAEKYRVDNLFLLPTMMFDLLQLDDVGNGFATVKAVLASGQELNPVLRKRFEERFRVPIQSNYGSTEVGHVAGWTARDIREGKWVPGAVGLLYQNVEVEIRDEAGTSLPPGEIGELWVKTDVTRGYVGEHGVDAGLLMVDGWVRSQDVGYLDDGGRLFLSGRVRDMIKCGGFQVWPSEIEEAILRLPFVRDVAVLSESDERLGEIPVAFVVADGADSDTDLRDRVTEGARERLASYKLPRKVVRVDAIPRNDAGKTDKNQLVRPTAGDHADR
jgi:long-chain acyl-CoA synthetase